MPVIGSVVRRVRPDARPYFETPSRMKHSPIALALVAALGAGTALPPSVALAQDGASMTIMPIRTGSSSIGGAFGVRLAVYDARSFELFWNRIPNAATYRVQVAGRTVQESGATSRFVRSADLAGGFEYTLSALDRSGAVVAIQGFRVQPASGTQLVAAGGTVTPTTPTAPVDGPGRPRDTPQAPQGLRGQLYSSTAGEVFWNRIPGATLSYEIRLGGQVVATTNGTSYFVANRPGLSGTTVEVVAIDTNGGRSGASSATLGSGTSAPTNPMAPVAPSTPATGPVRTGVSTIGGNIPVRLAVYDAQSFEITWERVPGATRYELNRSRRTVQTGTGVSRYESGIDSSATYTYNIIAINSAGASIEATTFTVSPRGATQLALGDGTSAPTGPVGPATPTVPTTPTNPMAPTAPPAGTVSLLDPVGSGSPLSGENYLSFLPAFYEVVNATPLEDAYARILPIADGLRAALDGEANGFMAESAGADADGTTFACPEGGRARVFPEPSRPAGQTTIAFDGCRVDGATLDGAMFENRSPSLAVFDTVGRSAPGTTLTYTGAGGTRLVIQGRRFEYTPDPAGSGSARRGLEWSASWTLRSDSGDLTVQDQTTFLNDPGPGAGDEFRTSLSMRGDLTSGRTINVVTLNPLRASEATGRYEEGQVLLRDASGGQLNLSLTEGGTNEVRVRFDTAGRVGERLVAQGDGSNTGFRRLDR